jgi:hypothetical protein
MSKLTLHSVVILLLAALAMPLRMSMPQPEFGWPRCSPSTACRAASCWSAQAPQRALAPKRIELGRALLTELGALPAR